MNKLLIALISLSILTYSCDRKKNTNTTTKAEEKEVKSEVVKKELTAIVDSMNKSWNDLITTDDQKFKDIKRLLDEISYTNSYNVVAHDSLVKKLDKVKALRYDQSLDTNAIDNYIAATDKYVLEVFTLKEKTKGIQQHPIADELVDDITVANSQQTIATKLENYNWWTNKYNSYLKKYRKHIEKLGDPYASYKEKSILFKQDTN